MSDTEMNLNLNPLIDVTFLLLIFFMVSINFRSVEGNLKTYLPKNQGMATKPSEKAPIQDVRVKLRSHSGQETTHISIVSLGEQETSWEDFGDMLVEVYGNVNQQAEDSPSIKIDAGIHVPTGDVVRVIDICTRRVLRNPDFQGAKIQYAGKPGQLKELRK